MMEIKFPSCFYIILDPHHLTRSNTPATSISPTLSVVRAQFFHKWLFLRIFIIFHYLLSHSLSSLASLYVVSSYGRVGTASRLPGGRWKCHPGNRTGVGVLMRSIRIHWRRARVLFLKLWVSPLADHREGENEAETTLFLCNFFTQFWPWVLILSTSLPSPFPP